MTITRPPRKPAAAAPATEKPAAPAKKTAAKKPAAPVTPETSPEEFIAAAHHAAPVAEAKEKAKGKGKNKEKSKDKAKEKAKDKGAKEDKKRKDKEAVLIRFEDEQLTLMDARAAALGLSRAAWVRMVVAKALMNKKR